jgi:Na+-translocating ferredoxin:NAD+ oxidoreductase RnfG subunit
MRTSNRVRSTLLAAVLALGISASGLLMAHESGFPEKTLKSVFPDATTFTARKKSLTAVQVKRIEQASGSKMHANDNPVNFFVAVGKAADNSGVLGMVVLVDTKGPKGIVDLAVGVKRDLTITKVLVVENKDESALSAAAFLDQFKGKGAAAVLAMGKDLKYSGAAASGEAVASAVRRGIQLLAEASKP